MNILHYCNNIDIKYGGPSRSVVSLCNALTALNINISLLTQFRHSIPINDNVKLMNFGSGHLVIRFFLFFRYTYTSLKQADLIHIHGIWDFFHVVLVLWCLITRKAYVLQPRGMLEPWSLEQNKIPKLIIFHLIEKYIARNSQGIICTSNLEKENIEALKFDAPTFILENGAYLPLFDKHPLQERNQTMKRFLFLSRIHEKKGIEDLINAFVEFKVVCANAKLTIAGNGEDKYVKYIKDKIKPYNDFIDYIGPVTDAEKVKIYAEHSFFVLPTFSENFGIVILEALTCGLPILTTFESSWVNLEVDNLGFLIKPNKSSIYLGLKRMSELSVSEYEELSTSAKIYSGTYDWSKIAKKAYLIYGSCYE